MGRESVSPGRESSPEFDIPSRRSSRASPGREITPTREYPRPWMFGARVTPPREGSPGADRERDWPMANMRFVQSAAGRESQESQIQGGTPRRRLSSKASIRDEPQIKNPAARALWEKWQHVGFMAWERMRRLYDKLNYLQELEKLKNFSWEEWL